MRKFTFPRKPSFIALAILIVGILTFSSADALFKRMPVFQAIQKVVLSISKLHEFVANDDYADYGLLNVKYPEVLTYPAEALEGEEIMLSNQDYAIQCNPTGDEEASEVWYDFRKRGANDTSDISLELELNTIYTCQGMVRTDHDGDKRLYTHHGSSFQAMICHEDKEDTVQGESRTMCETGTKKILNDSVDNSLDTTSRYIAFPGVKKWSGSGWYMDFTGGYVPRHTEQGEDSGDIYWKTDSNGVVLSKWQLDDYSDRLAYCRHIFGDDIVMVIDPSNPNEYRSWFDEINYDITAEFETLDFYGENNLRRPTSLDAQVFECETNSYHWEYDNWGEDQCDGYRYRNVECIDNNDIKYSAERECDESSRPASKESCTIPSACYDWADQGYQGCLCNGHNYKGYKCRNYGTDLIRNTIPANNVPAIIAPYPNIVSNAICEQIKSSTTAAIEGCDWGTSEVLSPYSSIMGQTPTSGCMEIYNDTPAIDYTCGWNNMNANCFSWHHTSNEGCGCDGIDHHVYTCVNDTTGTTVDDIYCSQTTTKPVSEETCTIPSSCYFWIDKGFNDCTCYDSQSKTYNCENSEYPNTTVAEYFCSHTTKPVTTQTCAAPTSCFEWYFGNSYENCVCTTYQKKKIYNCRNTEANTIVAESFCDSAGTKPVGYSDCSASELLTQCPCVAADWNAAAECSTGCYISNYSNTGTKIEGSTCYGYAEQSVNYCTNAKQCCSDYNCSTGYVCSGTNTCIKKYHLYYCNNGSWSLNSLNYSSSLSTTCASQTNHNTYLYCLETPTGNCCTSNKGISCTLDHYSGRTYDCDGVCSGGTVCTNPSNSTWASDDGCTWSCNTGYVKSGNSCVPKYNKYTCGTNGDWSLTASNNSTTISNCTSASHVSGTLAYCISQPSNLYCCGSNYGEACLLGHYTGQTYTCSGYCTGGTSCTKPTSSTWDSGSGCDWHCNTGYVLSGDSCIPMYDKYTCSNGAWSVATSNYATFAFYCSKDQGEGTYAFCLSTPTGTCIPPACTVASWDAASCSCTTTAYTAYGTRKTAYSNCTGTVGRPSASCAASECCSKSDCSGLKFCSNGTCKVLGIF